jgi:hypothetical protein
VIKVKKIVAQTGGSGRVKPQKYPMVQYKRLRKKPAKFGGLRQKLLGAVSNEN